MRLTSIDIGTNTILMLVADIDTDGTLTVIRDEHAIARLGKGVDANKMILPETFERVLGLLQKYKNISEDCGSEKILARGTSALRDAQNQSEFNDFIRKKLSFEVSVLTGAEEADLTYLGAISDFLQEGAKRNFAVLDIGGGSTELIAGQDLEVKSRQSLDIGSVRLTERFLKTSPPSSLGVSQALSLIRSQVTQFSPLSSTARLIGVAGTLTTLAAIDLKLPSFDREKVHGHLLTFDAVHTIFNQLRIRTLEELRSIPQIVPERADIILAGILILLETMKQLNANEIVVSDRGLRYGILLREFQETKTRQ
ncbi:MAG: Ppx/GppA family phosphatase [Ignavibacteriales bacterium]|nr:Ppx/GppA family phosphatase [Ignavibacteriales bacterium]